MAENESLAFPIEISIIVCALLFLPFVLLLIGGRFSITWLAIFVIGSAFALWIGADDINHLREEREILRIMLEE